MTALSAPGFPEAEVRNRACRGEEGAFPPQEEYGRAVFGTAATVGDPLDTMRLVPPVLVPRRLEKLIELGREPLPEDVDLTTRLGGFDSALPVYVSAFGSTRLASDGLGLAVARQAGALGVPLVIGENVAPVTGYGRVEEPTGRAMLLDRIRAYAEEVRPGLGGVVVQQSTEDADAEVWNLVYSDPNVTPLLEAGLLGFELKVGQGAKPGLGGLTLVDTATAERLAGAYALGTSTGSQVQRSSSPGTFTSDILRAQVRLMRNNFPRCRIWVKLPPGRDIAEAAAIAWAEGADAVTVDGAEGGTGWAPTSFHDVGLPLGECLLRIGRPVTSLLASGRMWEGTRATKALALGASGVGIGRAALVAVHERPADGLVNLVRCLTLELRMLLSALGKYAVAEVGHEDLWPAPGNRPTP